MNWYLKVLQNYVGFSGRARRQEYWMFTLFNTIFSLVLVGIDFALWSTPILASLYMVALFLPSLAVTVRRLHDTDRTGWWFLISLVPFVGGIILLVFVCLGGDDRPNRYGSDPKQLTH
ncbi:DUF805 domain-containing protein [Streptomyces sp. CAU 1734]|uniref:DUF805 domain-containing protein n=1 Tax=Streptomyces sp. CAU 1734 TaxID=3140360 RepID=UPI0032618327